MRVAIVTDDIYGFGVGAPSGFALRYSLIADALREAGHQVFFISYGAQRKDPSDSIDAAASSIEFLFVNTAQQAQSKSRAFRTARRIALAAGSTGFSLPWEVEIRQALHTWQPDHVLLMTPFRPASITLVPRREPVTYFAEEDLRPLAKGKLAPKLRIRPRLHRPQSVVAIAEHERAWVERAFGGTRSVVIPHAVDIDYWSENVTPASGASEVFAVGDFSQARNAEGLLQVLRQLNATNSEITVGLASARPVPSLILEEAGSRLALYGAVADVRPFYKAAMAALVPSFRSTGVKTQVLQAWASGCPVVCTTQACATVAGNHEVDLLASDNAKGMVEQLDRVLGDGELARTLVEGGLNHVKQCHSVEVLSKALDALLSRAKAKAS